MKDKVKTQNDIEDEQEDYLDKVNFLAEEKVKTLSDLQKQEWKKAISWFFLTDSIKKKIRNEIEHKCKTLDIIIILFSGLGLLTNGLQSLFYLEFNVTAKNNLYTIKVKGKSTNLVEILRFITTFSTIIVIILLIINYNIRKNLLIFKQQVSYNSSLWSTGLLIPLIVEIFLHLIHTPPYLNNVMINMSTTDTKRIVVPIDLDLFLSVFITFRAYLIFKYYANYSKWGDVRAERVCQECNAEGGFKFTCKAELKEHPYFVLFFLMIISILIFGYCLRNTEISFIIDVPLSHFQDWTHMWNGFWCITMTILTIGYGDYYPRTHFGRIITIIACLWGTLLESLMIVAITNTMDLSPQQNIAFKEIKHLLLVNDNKKKALNFIRLSFQARMLGEEYEDTSDLDLQFKQKMVYEKTLKKVQIALNNFREARKKLKTIERATTIEALVRKINISLNEDMDLLVRTSKIQVVNLLDHIKFSKYFQNVIKAYSRTLEQMTEELYKKIEGKIPNDGILKIEYEQNKKILEGNQENEKEIDNLIEESAKEINQLKEETEELNSFNNIVMIKPIKKKKEDEDEY